MSLGTPLGCPGLSWQAPQVHYAVPLSQACGGVAAVAGAAVAAPQAAGAPFWVGLRTVVTAAAAAALAPDEISSHPENTVSAAAAVVLPGLEEALLWIQASRCNLRLSLSGRFLPCF